ncbi:MAG: histidinol-phosphatase HisJ family protein [Lachnospiraceae bacterium]|nr:histidinol-phosphatase HisJ family protein [Lachnospiraceae bacterium]
MLYDTHLHTIPFSTDSGMVFSEVQKERKAQGLGLVLTEHMDYGFPPFDFDPDEYFKAYSPYRSDTLLLGVETGFTADAREMNRSLVRSHPFDMVIGSVHAVGGRDLYEDGCFSQFADKEEAFCVYLETIIENIRDYDDFDTLGHIDYICRVAPYPDPLLHYSEYGDAIDTILRILADREQSLEINTRLFANTEAVASLEEICRRFEDLGGRTVTVGSDAHRAEVIGNYLTAAYGLAETCGLAPVYYRERKKYPVTQ